MQRQERLLPIAMICSLLLAACAGADGKSGAAGQNGSSCSAHANGDGTTTISCTDGTSATVKDGSNGSAGASCTMTDNGNGTRTITCGTATVTISVGGVSDFALMSAAEKADASMSAVIKSITIPDDGRPVVTLKVSDRKGNGVKGLPSTAGKGVNWSVALLKMVPGQDTALGVNNSASDTWVSYMAKNATSPATAESAPPSKYHPEVAPGTLTDNGDGTYSYRFAQVINNPANAGTSYEPTKVHRLVILLNADDASFQPVNLIKDFIPATGADASGQYDTKVDQNACLECHSNFRAKVGSADGFHRGEFYDIRACTTCHNDQQRFSALGGYANAVDDSAVQADGTWTGKLVRVNGNAVIDLPVYIHKIHMGEDLGLKATATGTYAGVPDMSDITYPQDVRNCGKCHRDATTKAANTSFQKASTRVCLSCHDTTSFAATVPPGRTAHTGGAGWTDDKCSMCHGKDANTGVSLVAQSHTAVAPPDANNVLVGGTNGNTNAGYLAAAGAVPAGAHKIVALVNAVTRDTAKHPTITFKLQVDGKDAVFNTDTTGELFSWATGSPTLYWAYALPQDGIAAPADFNNTASGYLKRIWNGKATGASAGTLTGPDSNGWYKVVLTGTVIPDTATMLTGGVGYAYSLAAMKDSTGALVEDPSKTNRPITQIDLTKYPYNAKNSTGGLIVATADVVKVAVDEATNKPYAARRVIVDNKKCNSCHEQLGAAPTFHAGQRNDGPTCGFCHRPNQTSSGWSAASSSFIHGIHGAAKRETTFNWHAPSATQNYGEVTYPGVLGNCEQCHVAGSYDFSAAASAAALPNLLASTVGTGKYNSNATTNPNGYFSISPYVQSDNVKDYGLGFSVSTTSVTLPRPGGADMSVGTSYTYQGVASTSVKQGTTTCTDAAPCSCTAAAPCTASIGCTAATPCNAEGTTLVSTPIVAACTGCHDSKLARDHMESNGGSFYEPRATALQKDEQCLLCHGTGKVADIKVMHQ